jgi:putative ubiquitin-RnfH superfamily antitoxin RatB of RatAB toxin-antitoxin module
MTLSQSQSVNMAEMLAVQLCWVEGSVTWRRSFAVEPGTTVEQVIALALASTDTPESMAPKSMASYLGVSIWGHRVTHEQTVCAGDRIELLRALQIDPKAARHARVSAARAQNAKSGVKR